MRIIIVFSNDPRSISRARPGDVVLVARDEDGLKIKERYVCSSEGVLQLSPSLNLDEKIAGAKKINVEIIAHSSSGSKQVQSEKTPQYPPQSIPIDRIASWLEYDLLKDDIAVSH